MFSKRCLRVVSLFMVVSLVACSSPPQRTYSTPYGASAQRPAPSSSDPNFQEFSRQWPVYTPVPDQSQSDKSNSGGEHVTLTPQEARRFFGNDMQLATCYWMADLPSRQEMPKLIRLAAYITLGDPQAQSYLRQAQQLYVQLDQGVRSRPLMDPNLHLLDQVQSNRTGLTLMTQQLLNEPTKEGMKNIKGMCSDFLASPLGQDMRSLLSVWSNYRSYAYSRAKSTRELNDLRAFLVASSNSYADISEQIRVANARNSAPPMMSDGALAATFLGLLILGGLMSNSMGGSGAPKEKEQECEQYEAKVSKDQWADKVDILGDRYQTRTRCY